MRGALTIVQREGRKLAGLMVIYLVEPDFWAAKYCCMGSSVVDVQRKGRVPVSACYSMTTRQPDTAVRLREMSDWPAPLSAVFPPAFAIAKVTQFSGRSNAALTLLLQGGQSIGRGYVIWENITLSSEQFQTGNDVVQRAESLLDSFQLLRRFELFLREQWFEKLQQISNFLPGLSHLMIRRVIGALRVRRRAHSLVEGLLRGPETLACKLRQGRAFVRCRSPVYLIPVSPQTPSPARVWNAIEQRPIRPQKRPQAT
ncbi:MAG: hypothetical protein JWQ50_9336 [Caballeronia mineralivorans]|jgi:hypothetical protein|nr:hypothetical protein [Caballeronia mineralivorans]